MKSTLRLDTRALFRALLCQIVLAVLFLPSLSAQPAHDTKGKVFWATFTENFGSGGDGEPSKMRLYFSSRVPTTVSVTFNQTGATRTLNLPKGDSTYEMKIDEVFSPAAELRSGEEISEKSFYIVADDEITLYGVSIRFKSADAFLGLPDDVLTNSYIVLAYPNGFDSTDFSSSGQYDKPSQFAVIATEDGTIVRVESPAVINGRSANVPFNVGLDKGQVFFGQAQLGRPEDVSGTQLKSNKPIAVFSGVQRTSIPTRVGNFRDYLVEQMPPLEVWGNEALITPHFPITPQSTDIAVVRVLAAFDGTEWSVNGVPRGTLPTAKSVEIPLTGPMRITATKPILVAQYEHSVSVSLGSQSGLGDPFMMVIPPPEQFDTAYSFQSIIDPEFVVHFINVIVPDAAINSLRLDNKPVNAQFTKIPTSGYSFAQLQVPGGSHFIECDSSFGICVYGFGEANSYGYTGGMLFQTLVHDFEHPEIGKTDNCGQFTGFAADSRITDKGIDSLIVTNDAQNVTVDIEPFTPGADTVRFTGRLNDPYRDGTIVVKAVDVGGRSSTRVYPVPGFTVRTVGMIGDSPVGFDTLSLFNGTEQCQIIELENYGRFPQEIRQVTSSPLLQWMSVKTQLPLTIEPGKRVQIEVCAKGWVDTAVDLSIIVTDQCVSRPVALVPLVSGVDTTAPLLNKNISPCGDEVVLSFNEPNVVYSGINEVTFDSLVNAEYTLTPGEEGFPARSVEARLRRIDPRQDLYYRVRLADASGNSVVESGVIGGFTLAVQNDIDTTQLGIRLNADWVGDSLPGLASRCDEVRLYNYGSQQLDITDIRMKGNLLYSIPPSQLPILIPPGESRMVKICIEGREPGEQIDTLLVIDKCRNFEDVLLRTNVGALTMTGVDRCNNAISVTNFGPTKRLFLGTPLPNPASGAAAVVDIGLDTDDVITLEVLDAQGNEALTIMRAEPLEAGVNRIAFDVSKLESGAYFCRMVTARGGLQVVKMLVSH